MNIAPCKYSSQIYVNVNQLISKVAERYEIKLMLTKAAYFTIVETFAESNT